MNESLKPQRSPETVGALEFPVIKEKMSLPSIRSMDEINAWIEQDYVLFYNQEKLIEEKIKMSVYDKFVLK